RGKPPWTPCPRPCASSAWSAQFSSTPGSPRPWCYQSPSADTAAPFLEPGAERVVIFHLITEGECFVELGDDPPLLLTAGDVVVFPQGDAHRMSSAPGLKPATG